jgi:GWxTD domain-containing protein
MKKQNHCVFFIILIIFLFGDFSLSSQNVHQNSKAVFYFNQGKKLLSNGDTLSAINSLEKAIFHHRKYSEAYHRLAQIHFALGKLDNRVKARKYLKNAVRYDSKNITYLHTQLEFYYHILFYYTAQKTAEKILKLKPNDAKSFYFLGRMSELNWLKYDDMRDIKKVSPEDEEEIIAFFSDFADKDLNEAMKFYKKAIISDPTFTDAHYRFAFIFFEKQLYEKMEEVLLEALNILPDNKDFYQFLGLCYFRMNQLSKSLDAYNKAIALMGPEELSLIEAVDLVSTPDEGRIFRNYSDEEKLAIQYKHWQQSDPLFLTEENERKLEHYGRVAYANLRFSNKLKGIAGWQTAQGNAYIRFGPPTYHNKTWPQVGGGNASDMVKPSIASWIYPEFSIRFEDFNFDGHFTFFNGSQFNDLIKKQPEWYEFKTPEERLNFSFSFARFRDDDNKTVLEVYQNIPQDEIFVFERESLVRGIFLFDQNWNEKYRSVTPNPYFSDYNDSLFVGWERFHVDPGKYTLIVEYQDKYSDRVGQLREKIEITEEKNKDISMSDLIMAWEIESPKDERELTRRGKKIVPNTLSIYPMRSEIPIFFEIYNLTIGVDGKTNYRITFTVKSGDSKNRTGILKRLFGSGKTPTQIGTTYDYNGTSETDFIYHSISLSNPEKRKYQLIVEIEDLITNKIISRESSFLLK